MFIDKFLKDHVMIWLIHRYYGTTYVLVDDRDVIYGLNQIESFTLKNGCSFKATEHSQHSPSTQAEYDWNDLRSTDIVLDIGAHVGMITIRLAKTAKSVFAVEPLFTDELEGNVALNELHNVRCMKAMLGNPQNTQISNLAWGGMAGSDLKVLSFEKMVEFAGGTVDFLKCDCEGAESNIPPAALLPIRRIEIELHGLKDPKIIALRAFIHSNWDTHESLLDPVLDRVVLHAFGKKTDEEHTKSPDV